MPCLNLTTSSSGLNLDSTRSIGTNSSARTALLKRKMSRYPRKPRPPGMDFDFVRTGEQMAPKKQRDVITLIEPQKYAVFSASIGNCPKCGADEFRVLFEKDGTAPIVERRTHAYKNEEAEKTEHKPVFVGPQQPAYTGQAQPQPDYWETIVYPAKPERIHHTCGRCGYLLVTLCKDAK
jgi:hypothetical protein